MNEFLSKIDKHYCGLVVFVAGFVAALCAGAACVPPAWRIVILTILTVSFGRSFASRGMRAIFFTNSTLASSHCPKIVYPPFKLGYATSVTKNCEPLVFGPAL